MHLVGQRLVLQQLEVLVLEDHGAFGHRDIAADLKRALVGLRDLAARQVFHHVAHAGTQRFAARLDQQALRLGIGGKEVGGRHRIDPLRDRKADALARLGIGLNSIGQLGQGARIEQVERGSEAVWQVGAPRVAGEAPVVQRPGGLGLALGHGLPQG
jgi:hypothetical protein